MTTEELQQAGQTWKQVHISTVISKRNTVETPGIHKYDLKVVKGKIQMMQKVVIPPFMTVMVNGAAKLTIHSKHVNVIVKPTMSNETTLPWPHDMVY